MLFQLRLKERYRRIKERSGNSKDVPSGLDSKQSACNAGDPGLISASERSPGGGHGNLLQYSCLENPTEEPGGLQFMGVAKSWTSLCYFTFNFL